MKAASSTTMVRFKTNASFIKIKGPVYRISIAARMSIIGLLHSEVLLAQNHRNLNCVSMHI